jgi:hypothetical protein
MFSNLVALLALIPSLVAKPVSNHLGSLGERQSPAPANYTYNFGLFKPVPVPSSNVCAVETLMVHTFANSYGVPFVANYTPPACEFNSVVVTFTSNVAGRQFDRISMMYLTDTEVWRTSTQEPIKTGIYWTYTKDLSAYLALWKQPQTLIFELDNIFDSTYTGQYNTTLTATFFTVEDAPVKADVILPISALQGSEGKQSVFNIPEQNATVNYTIPSNVTRAMVSLSANGQIDEEFWYTNVLSTDQYTFNDTAGPLLGGGTFREVQLLIDGHLAGVVWPFPVIFTGGFAPGLWRPMVGIQAFDLAESEIDITPFLQYISDGEPHSFTIKVKQVANVGNGSATLVDAESYWLATGKIFLFFGSETTAKPGSYMIPDIMGAEPKIETSSFVTTDSDGTNLTLSYTVTASREFSVSSEFGTFSQNLSYSSAGFLEDGGYTQTNTQLTKGSQRSEDTLAPSFNQDLTFSYPVAAYNKYIMFNNGSALNITASVNRTLSWTDSGRPDISIFSLVAGPSEMEDAQNATGFYSSLGVTGGNTEESFTKKSYGSSYARHVIAGNQTVFYDSNPDIVMARGKMIFAGDQDGLVRGPRGMLGRVPGLLKKQGGH